MITIKKVLSALLAAAMALTISAPVFAQEQPENPSVETGNGTINITNAAVGTDYGIYRIFDLESFEGNNYSYYVTASSDWYGFVTDGAGAAYVTLTNGPDDIHYVTLKNDVTDTTAAAKAFADAAKAYAAANDIDPDATKTAGADGQVTFTKIPLGYYLVTSTQGTLVMLDTTNTTADIVDKNTQSTITKDVDDKYYGIGEDIEFTLTLTIADTDAAERNYTIHDQMGSALDLVNDDDHPITVTVKNGSETVNRAYTTNVENYKEHSNCTFEVVFAEGVLHTGDVVTVTYTGRFNGAAIADGDTSVEPAPAKNDNDTWFNDSERVTVTVYTAKVLVDKIIANTSTPLAGATFALKNSDNKYYSIDDKGNVTWVDTLAEATTYTTVVDEATNKAEIAFEGIGSGTYVLEEVAAPAGYNKLANDVSFTISGTPAANNEANAVVVAHTEEVANSTGSLLPTTGGMGTTLMIAVGAILLIATGVLLVTKRRMHLLGNED